MQTSAQAYDPDKVNSKVSAVYNGAIQEAQDGHFGNAKQLLLKAIAMDGKFVDGYLSYAGICGENKQYDSSITMYQKAFALDSIYSFDYQLPYSINLAGLGKFEAALTAINNFLNSPHLNERSKKAGNYRKKTYEFALDLKQKKGFENNNIDVKNLGDSINTFDSEYFPSIPIEGDKLVFTRRVGGYNEDFYEAERAISHEQLAMNNSNLSTIAQSSQLTAQSWHKAKPLAGNINTDQNEGAQCISQDGEWLIFTACNRPDGFGSCDLYISYKTPDGRWTEAENMGPKINTEFWESVPTLSPDKKDLYFSSRRPGGYGAADIWVSHRSVKGVWGIPENLGPNINTVGEESSPFIHADNQSLYFTSDGLPGYGKSDLFVTKKNEKGEWGIPQNLGYPINTIEEEGSFIVTADGQTAYYASDRSDTRGGLDIYTFQLPKAVQPTKTLWVKGKVFDADTKKGLPSSVELKDKANNVVTENVQTDETGNYLVTLPIGKNYSFTINRKGYLFYSDEFVLMDNNADSTYTKDIPLQPIAANSTLVLKNILFETNSFQLKSSSFIELDKVLQLLKDNPNLKIQISGHTDNIGKPEDNLKLSTSRAKAVVDYLVLKGILPTRLSSKGFGSTKPVAENTTEIGRAKNRRTELMVIGN